MPGYIPSSTPDDAIDVTDPFLSAWRNKTRGMGTENGMPVSDADALHANAFKAPDPYQLPPDTPVSAAQGDPLSALNSSGPSGGTAGPLPGPSSDAGFRNHQNDMSRIYAGANPDAQILKPGRGYSMAGVRDPGDRAFLNDPVVRQRFMDQASMQGPDDMLTGSVNGKSFAMAPSVHASIPAADRLMQLYNSNRDRDLQTESLKYGRERETRLDTANLTHQTQQDAIAKAEADARIAQAGVGTAAAQYGLTRQQQMDKLRQPVTEAQAGHDVTAVGQQLGPADERRLALLQHVANDQHSSPQARNFALKAIAQGIGTNGRPTSPSEDQAFEHLGEPGTSDVASDPMIQQHSAGVDQLLGRGHWNLQRDAPSIITHVQGAVDQARQLGAGEQSVQQIKNMLKQKIQDHLGDYTMFGYGGGDLLLRAVDQIK